MNDFGVGTVAMAGGSTFWSDRIDLGSRDDTLRYSHTPGRLALDDPRWSVDGNLNWIRHAAAARRTFRLVTPVTRDNLWEAAAGRPKVHRLEVNELQKQGYRLSPDKKFMLPPP